MRDYADMLRESCLRTRLAYWLLERGWGALGFLIVPSKDSTEFEYRSSKSRS